MQTDMSMSKNKSLTEATEDELRAEIERRNLAQKQITAPRPVSNPDFSALRSMIIDIVEDTCRDQCWPKDSKQYIYELAIKTVYGPTFWEWAGSVQWDGE